MKMALLITIVFTLIAFLQIPTLLKKRYWRELIAFSFLYLVAFSLSLLHVLGVQIPSPMRGVRFLIEDVLHLKY